MRLASAGWTFSPLGRDAEGREGKKHSVLSPHPILEEREISLFQEFQFNN